MIFTDSEGREWEEVEAVGLQDARNTVIRPVKQEPKYTVWVNELYDGEKQIKVGLGHLPLDQAQLIKELIELVMAEIHKPPQPVLTTSSAVDTTIFDAIEKARQSMRENN